MAPRTHGSFTPLGRSWLSIIARLAASNLAEGRSSVVIIVRNFLMACRNAMEAGQSDNVPELKQRLSQCGKLAKRFDQIAFASLWERRI
ncbi:hypothetical protein GCM10011371_15100 [Novosphingobium marinum]|nr:hypothetical protein GCM10011371_15100 [Novosphingobium marinum]